MLDFYLELVLKKAPATFRHVMTPLRFWAWVALTVGVWAVPDEWQERYLPFAIPNWALPALLGIVFLYALLKSNYEETTEPKRELKELKDKLASAESTERLRTVKLVQRLRQLETAGINLRKEMLKTYLPDKHRPQHKAWQDEILALLKKDAPEYENEMLLAPEGRIQLPRGSNDRDFAIRDMDEWLAKLHSVIKQA